MTVLEATKPELKEKITWNEWGNRWQGTDYIGTLLGLLSTGFEATLDPECADAQKTDRVLFYLSLADKHLITRDERATPHKRLAHAAFKALGRQFFKYGYTQLFSMQPAVTERLFDYFSPRHVGCLEGEGLNNLSSYDGSPEMPYARDFLLNLCLYVVRENNVSASERGFNEETIELLKKSRVQALRVLHAWEDGFLYRLIPSSYIGWSKFDEELLATLRELSLRQQVLNGLGGWRNAASVEEALVFGSSAAALVTLAQAAQKSLVEFRI